MTSNVTCTMECSTKQQDNGTKHSPSKRDVKSISKSLQDITLPSQENRTMNVERLKAIRDRIKEHPENFNYSQWFTEDGYSSPVMLGPERFERLCSKFNEHDCNTHACVAGHAALMYCTPTEYARSIQYNLLSNVAKKLLDLTNDQAEFLFYDAAESIRENIKDETLLQYLNDREDAGGAEDEWSTQSALDKLEFLINIEE